MGEVVTVVLLGALVVMAIAGLAATGYLWKVFAEDHRRPRSRFLLTVCVVSSLIEAATTVIALLAGRRLLGYESLPGALQLTVVSLLALEVGPIIFAIVIYRVRRHKLPNRPVIDPDGEGS